MRTSYNTSDVTLLLKDITGLVEPTSTAERERLIQSGRHYCEMLPIEYMPTQPYLSAYEKALENYAEDTAQAVAIVSKKLVEQKGSNVVLVSLARAGIPAGILMKHYIKQVWEFEVPHYAISIIRGRGIDQNAIKFLLGRYQPEQIQFVDGWIGKGAILGQLEEAVKPFQGLSPELAVIADPAGLTKLAGTYKDLLIASSCLNSTVSGLISRTFLREDIILEQDFHGAVYYGELAKQDRSYEFISEIEKYFPIIEEEMQEKDLKEMLPNYNGLEEVKQIAKDFEISNINFIKPGIGEATRVLLRRMPWKILIAKGQEENPMLYHLLELAKEKGVSVEVYPLKRYQACGIIRKFADT